MTENRKPIMTPDPADPLEQDTEQEVSDWTREQGERAASEEGIQMTDERWAVVDFLRDYYLQHGAVSSGRELAKALDEAFAEKGGNGYLHQLFPDGPVAQGSRIGGLPVPPHTEDESFGSSM